MPVLPALVVAAALDAPSSVADRLDLVWKAPEGCPTEADVRASIGNYLGRARFSERIDEVSARAWIEPPGRRRARWRLRVVVDLPTGVVERDVEADRCDRLGAAAALVVAVALDPLRVEAQVAPRKAPSTEAPAPAPPEPAPPPRRVAPPVVAGLAVGGGVETGLLTRVAGLAVGSLSVRAGRFRAAVGVRYLAPRTVRPFDDPPDAGARIWGAVAHVEACYAPRVRRLQFPLCPRFEAGALRAKGVDLPEVRASTRPVVAAGLSSGLRWHGRHGVGWYLAVTGTAVLLRARFSAEGLGDVYTAGWASLQVAGGLSVEFRGRRPSRRPCGHGKDGSHAGRRDRRCAPRR